MTDKAFLSRAIDQGRGAQPADLVIKSVGLLDIVYGGVTVTDIAICGDRIVGTYETYSGTREIDGSGLFAVPGFIDTHLHVESSLVTPQEFDRCVLPHGVTTAICDPHEIANVLGLEGIRFFLESAETTIMDLRVQLSSCVPATAFETSGAELLAKDLIPLAAHPKVIGLAEFMNFPGVLSSRDDVLDKLVAFQDGHIDGHAPLVRGYDLNGYLAARIRTDHETTIAEDGREKLKKGLAVLIREGSVTKDLHALAEILDEHSSSFCCLCTDDRNPLDIAEEGHLDYMVRTLISLGRPLHHVYRAASWSAANAFGLKDRGMIAPGRRADIVLVGDLAECSVKTVISAGRVVDDALFATRKKIAPVGLDSMKVREITPADFRIPGAAGELSMIGVAPGRVVTDHVRKQVSAKGNERVADPANDIAKVAVIERHGKDGSIGRGFVTGFGMRAGRHRLVGRPRQPQYLRRRHGRRRHGGCGQPAARDRRRLRGGGRRQGGGRTGAAASRADEPRAVRGGPRRTDAVAPCGARDRLHAAGTVPPSCFPATPGHSAHEDHQFRPLRRRSVRTCEGMTATRSINQVALSA